jgi:hypothetical protein
MAIATSWEQVVDEYQEIIFAKVEREVAIRKIEDKEDERMFKAYSKAREKHNLIPDMEDIWDTLDTFASYLREDLVKYNGAKWVDPAKFMKQNLTSVLRRTFEGTTYYRGGKFIPLTQENIEEKLGSWSSQINRVSNEYSQGL